MNEILSLNFRILEEKDKIAKLENQVINLSHEISSKNKEFQDLKAEKENIQTRYISRIFSIIFLNSKTIFVTHATSVAENSVY